MIRYGYQTERRNTVSGHLYGRICDPSTLFRAWSAVKANAGVAGADEVSLGAFEQSLNQNLAGLSRSLLNQSYVPEPTKAVMIPKSDGTKRRLCVPSVKDRVVQQATRTVLEPLFESKFLPCSFGYRPGMGPLRAVGRVETLLHEGRVWAAGADIDDFFDSISHTILLRLVAERVWEKPVLRLIELWLRTGSVHMGSWRENLEGVPQGGVISPLLSNIYLHPFDMEMTRRGYGLVRYADDYLFLEPERNRAVQAAREAAGFLARELLLKTEAPEVTHAGEGFVFLGFLFQGGKKTIAPGKLEEMKRKVTEVVRSAKTIPDTVSRLNLLLAGWRNYYGAGDTEEQLRLIETVVFRELGTRLKTLPVDSRAGTRQCLERLEFLLPKSQAGRAKFISLLFASAVSGPGRTESTSPPEPAQAVKTRRRQYERLAEEESVLVVDRPGSFVGKTSRRVVVRERGRRTRELPLFRLRNIIIESNGVGVSSDLVRFCSGQGVTISFQDERGRPCAFLVGADRAAYPLTIAQLETQKSERGNCLARAFIEGKVTNQMNLLRYYAKYRGRAESEFRQEIPGAVEKLAGLLEQLAGLESDERFGGQLFALEGQAGGIYWGLVKALLASDACFERREKKGATDLVNSLLNYGYGILYSLMHRLLVLAGLNPCVGFIHRGPADRSNLLFDVVEEFRQPVVDRAVIRLLRKKARLGMDGVLLDQRTKHRLVTAVMDNLGSPVYYRGGRSSLRNAMEGQVQRLVGFIKGREQYRPFIFH